MKLRNKQGLLGLWIERTEELTRFAGFTESHGPKTFASQFPKALLGTKGNVVRIAADGSRVALITTAVPKSCDRIVLWNAQTRAVATWQTGIDCAGGAISGGQTVTEVAVAGQRVAWVEEAAGNLEDLQLRTAVPGGKPKEVDFAENGNGDEEAPDGEWTYTPMSDWGLDDRR